MAMNYSRFKSVLNNMTSAAQKVYEAVPLATTWTHDQIHREMRRIGNHMDYRTMQGCVNSLCGAGLVREAPIGGQFIRTEVRGKPGPKPIKEQLEALQAESTTPMAQPTVLTPVPTTPRSPVDILGDLAAKCRKLADEVDAAALAAQAYVEESDRSTEKLRQLQTLLKSLS